jgi:hypothetical protein
VHTDDTVPDTIRRLLHRLAKGKVAFRRYYFDNELDAQGNSEVPRQLTATENMSDDGVGEEDDGGDWVCPYSCGKIYKKRGGKLQVQHLTTCPNLAASRDKEATGAVTSKVEGTEKGSIDEDGAGRRRSQRTVELRAPRTLKGTQWLLNAMRFQPLWEEESADPVVVLDVHDDPRMQVRSLLFVCRACATTSHATYPDRRS